MDELQLVDPDDHDIGFAEKELCHHIPTTLHRAFSIFIFNKQGQILIHKRADGKKTWPRFWSNACCSHPRKGESLEEATTRRLHEELGFTCPLIHAFTFAYKADYDDHYGENEIDHVFIGIHDGAVKPDEEEIADWKFVPISELLHDIKANPEQYTPWFKVALPGVLQKVSQGDTKANATMSGPHKHKGVVKLVP